MLGPAIGLPATRWSRHAALCRHNDLVPVPLPASKGTGHEPLVMADVLVVEAVDIGGIDERDSGIESRVDHPDPLLLRRTILNG